MKYLIPLLVFSLSPNFSFAQQSIDGLAKAERSFAAYAIAHGIKPAFLQFTDSLVIMFDKESL
jgi:hypothetical protein